MFISFSAVFGSFVIILVQDCHGKSSIQQEEACFYQNIGIKFKEGTS